MAQIISSNFISLEVEFYKGNQEFWGYTLSSHSARAHKEKNPYPYQINGRSDDVRECHKVYLMTRNDSQILAYVMHE